MDEVRYMISDASKQVEVKDHVLRYWEEQLELKIDRNEMGHRYYKASDIELLRTIKYLMEQGFQLKGIKLILPNIHKVKTLDDQTRIRLREELNGKVIEMYDEEITEQAQKETNEKKEEQNALEESLPENTYEKVLNFEDHKEASVDEQEESLIEETSLTYGKEETGVKEEDSKVGQFKAIMNHIILEALRENNVILSEEIGSNVTGGVIKEMNYLLRVQEEREEERFKKFDATLRDYQRGRSMTAVSLDGKPKKKSKFMRKNKVYI